MAAVVGVMISLIWLGLLVASSFSGAAVAAGLLALVWLIGRA